MGEPILSEDARFEPWWWEDAPPQPRAEAVLPAEADVAIVGAGFTGLSAALELARAGRSVVVLEAGIPGEGASKRNGGMIGSGHRAGLGELSKRYGREAAIALIKEGTEALEYTVGLIEREQIDCRFTRCGRFRGAWSPAVYDAMGREVEELKQATGLEVDMVSRAEQDREIVTETYHGGSVYHRHGGLHPGLLHQGLLERAEAAGAVVASDAPVMAIARDGRRVTVATPRGALAAREVIVATNGYTGPASPAFRRRLIPVPSYIIATEPLAEGTVTRLIPGGRMIVETRARHCYYRPSPDGRRIVFGGRAAVSLIDTRTSARVLHRLMTGIFPALRDATVSHSWSGFVAFSRDNLPHLGKREGIHYALGYNGSGVAMAPYLGHKIALQVLGRHEGLSPFDQVPFRAYPLYSGRPWFLPWVERWYRLKDKREGTG
jgi:glycine/D-amino acid oxidase-like deaminating enzyme